MPTSRKTVPTTPDFLTEEVVIRGHKFVLQELSIGEYDELVQKATTTQTDPVTGREFEQTDNTLLLKMMVLKSCVDPKLTPEKLAALPMRVTLKLNAKVNEMHFSEEPDDEEESTEGEEQPEEEAEEEQGNG